ncbi:hypothetical protein FGW37_17160 [Streptomyces rectiverticillatus]|uniref:hypothetical protein n=1 Tax=Streptomyces rectiverticillatus TaxID=173860 RepID=UPI0015C2F8BB|nr:hypothetical protein [Streptomyces rectiverticillatus]QLE73092.1 hypothetical protein FGW37_17160 [Streptomyces rectiverticillatus]
MEAANAGWFALACEHGVFGPEREFLLALPSGEDGTEWRRVRLLDAWDLMGEGSACGEFLMSSLDGRVAMRGTTYQRGVSSIVVPEPWRAPTIRTYMDRISERVTRGELDGDRYRTLAHAWRQYVRHHTG